MKPPISYRNHIPFFCEKSTADYRRDKYERYEEIVLRQASIHLADALWDKYPMQGILDLIDIASIDFPICNVVDIGCGVGRWIADAASRFPSAHCWGIDYSYQMLRQANDFWILGKDLEVDCSAKGFAPISIPGHRYDNLNFGLARAEDLPFEDASQDLILSSFLWDRVEEPMQVLMEMWRVLSPKGQLILVSPLNFEQSKHWDQFFPIDKLRQRMSDLGWDISHWDEAFVVQEPMDARGNAIHWNCLALVAGKKNSF